MINETLFRDDGKFFNPDDYPPTLAIWFASAMDTVTWWDWRHSLGVEDEAAFPIVTPIAATFPPLLTFTEFAAQQNTSKSQVSLLFDYAFFTNSTILGSLGQPLTLGLVLCLMLVLRRVKFFLLPLFSEMGRRAGRRTHGPDWEKANHVRIVKFGEYVYRLIFHSMISLYGIFAFCHKLWWAREGWRWIGTIHFFKQYPFHEIEPAMVWYYMIQAAYNTDAMISLMELSFRVRVRSPFRHKTSSTEASKWQWPVVVEWSDTVRGDFSEMLVHHLATNLLCYGSSMTRFTRPGSFVFLLHDVSDVPVDLSKLANFLKWKVTTVSCFLLMCFTWLATRLYILPFGMFRSALLEAHYALEYTKLTPLHYYVWQRFFSGLIGLLILLHLSWFSMFIKMFWTLVKKKECHDLSEFKNGEKQKDN